MLIGFILIVIVSLLIFLPDLLPSKKYSDKTNSGNEELTSFVNEANTNESVLTPSVKLGENIFTSLKSSIKTNISKKYLQSTSWMLIKKDMHTLFTFLDNGRLLITENGRITEAKYELLIQSKSIILSRNNEAEHYFFLNIYDDYFFINKISTDEVIIFVNHNYYDDKNRDEFLEKATILKNIILKN